MATTPDTIDHATLARLVEAGAVRGADVIGCAEGWGVVVRYGMTHRTLAARRGAVRTFRKFETLVDYLKEVGTSHDNVNAADFDAVTLKANRVRPDASARMGNAFEAKAHADWLRAKAALSLGDWANPRRNVSHKEAMAGARAAIDAKRRPHAG